MFRIVVGEFCHGEEAGLVFLLIVVVDSEVLFEDGVQPLRLAICLGMEGGRPVGSDSQEFDESSPKVGSEDRVSVANEGFGQVMNFDDVLVESRCHVLRRHRFCGWNEMRMFGVAIDDH